ncbi:hypothetical protein B0T16DRAFT_459086 [Cercophora newfieldiana]|uniref:Cell wall mannoprotein PIR1-like C-terminal domain-containing protein n=1 Tax=Cercophora newfieldiana TaxID=92897 RepID=A0AA39XZX4_9PEZI|nr:hypothetical protein B0T16DRAFT_459086 [Cercophora newfieldiana]
MAKSSCLLFILGGLVASTLAGRRNSGTDLQAGSNCCQFTLSSTGSFDCPAGELEDGQIRLNGTYDTSTFCIDKEGGITNSRGFGCIVTEEPTTQIQCDHGKKPTPGFSLDTNNTLLYKGSPSFFACPATDTEYNIYVSPNFGQTKCFPITLQSDGCGTKECPPASTVWETAWYTQVVNQTVMLTQTELVPCSTSSPPPPPPVVTPPTWINTTKSCTKSKCQPTQSLVPSGKPPCQKGECHLPSDGAPWTNHTSTSISTSTSTSTTSIEISTGSDSPTMPSSEEPTLSTSTTIIPPSDTPVGAPPVPPEGVEIVTPRRSWF